MIIFIGSAKSSRNIILGGRVMENFNLNEMTLEKAIDFFKDNVGALVIADSKNDSYKLSEEVFLISLLQNRAASTMSSLKSSGIILARLLTLYPRNISRLS